MENGSPVRLFASKPLREELLSATKVAVEMLLGSQAEEVLNTAGANFNFTEFILRLATFRIPAICRGDAYLEPPTYVTVTRQEAGRQSKPLVVPRFILAVPATGQLSLLIATPSEVTSPPPVYGQINQEAGILRLHCDGVLSPSEVRACFEKQLDQIEMLLARTQAELEAHNRLMTKEFTAAIHERRAKVLVAQDMQASIGYAIKRRPDADRYAVPVTRVRIAPRRQDSGVSAKPYVPEPALAEADYEQALAVLWNARNALERSPSMSAKLDEQEIRDLLLVMLNAQFEGKAGGEVFNCTGKTNILIRDGDRNVFIGECKIFDPRNKQSVGKVVTDALTQLLGYLVWRDTKAALLLFIRDTDVSSTIRKALTAVSEHPHCKRHGKINNEERHDFVLHAAGDKNREIHLAFLPFLIGGRKPVPDKPELSP